MSFAPTPSPVVMTKLVSRANSASMTSSPSFRPFRASVASDVPDAKPALLPSLIESSSGRRTPAIAYTSPAEYAVAEFVVSTLPMALSTVSTLSVVVERSLDGRWKLNASFSRPL